MSGVADPLAGLSPEQRELLLRRLARARAAAPASPPAADALVPRPRGGGSPRASIGQEGIWEIDRMDPGNPSLNILYPVRLRGPLDPAALGRAVDEVVRRHDSLRTTFAVRDDVPVQVVHPTGAARLEVADLSGLPAPEREAALRARSNAELSRRFSLEHGPLFAATLLVLGPDEHALLLVMHHVVSDGYSLDVLFRDLTACYVAFAEGRPAPLAPPRLQYADWSDWQRARFEGPRGTELAAWWRDALHGMPLTLPLPTDHPRPLKRFQRGAGYPFRIPARTADGLRALGRGEGATLFMTMLALFQLVLHRWTGAEDFGVGTPVANRTRMEEEELIGYLINLLVLRARLEGEPSFRALLARVRATVSSAFAHQEFPFESLWEVLRPPPMRCHPFFQVMFILQNSSGDLHLPGLRVELLPADRTAVEYDFTLDVAEMPDGSLACGFEYSTELFDADTMARMAVHYRRLADAVAAEPDVPISALPLLTTEETRRLLVEWSGPAVERPAGRCAHHLFEAHARAAPDAPALRVPGGAMTYGALDGRASSLAMRLRARGVGPERCVGIRIDPSPERVIALLAVWKAGGAVLILPPDAEPPARWLSGDAGRPLVLTHASAGFVEGGSVEWMMVDAAAALPIPQADPAMLEGAALGPGAAAWFVHPPDGGGDAIVVDHAAAVNAALGLRHALDVRPGDRVLASADAVSDVLRSLCAGATLVLPSPDAPDLARVLADEAVTHAILPGAAGADLAAAELPALRVLAAVAEPGPSEAAGGASGREVVRLYGLPAAPWMMIERPSAGAGPSLGHPLASVRLYVVDSRLRLLPVGVAGELCVGGAGLGRGYAGRPAETASRFLPDPFSPVPGARLFRTGAWARWRPEGGIELSRFAPPHR